MHDPLSYDKWLEILNIEYEVTTRSLLILWYVHLSS